MWLEFTSLGRFNFIFFSSVGLFFFWCAFNNHSQSNNNDSQRKRGKEAIIIRFAWDKGGIWKLEKAALVQVKNAECISVGLPNGILFSGMRQIIKKNYLQSKHCQLLVSASMWNDELWYFCLDRDGRVSGACGREKNWFTTGYSGCFRLLRLGCRFRACESNIHVHSSALGHDGGNVC